MPLSCNQIIPGLYLGAASDAAQKKELQKLGITHILSCAKELPPLYPDDFTYMHLNLEDRDWENIERYFDISRIFIKQGLKRGNILVHCMAGVSRSTTIVAAYLMSNNGLSVQTALKHIKTKRPRINPNQGFIQQLHRL